MKLLNKVLAIWLATMVLAGCVLSPENEPEPDNQQTANLTDEDTSVNDVGLSTAELTQELEALRKSHKKLERLSELEGDLMLLLNELAKHPNINEGPTGFRPELSTEMVEPDEFFSAQPQQKLVIAKKPNQLQEPEQDTQGSRQQGSLNTVRKTWSNKEQGPNSPPDQLSHPVKQNTGSTPPHFHSANHMLWLGFFVSEQAALAGRQRLERRINFSTYGLNIQVVNNANTRGQYYGLVLGPFQNQQQASSFCSALARYGQYCKLQTGS